MKRRSRDERNEEDSRGKMRGRRNEEGRKEREEVRAEQSWIKMKRDKMR